MKSFVSGAMPSVFHFPVLLSWDLSAGMLVEICCPRKLLAAPRKAKTCLEILESSAANLRKEIEQTR